MQPEISGYVCDGESAGLAGTSSGLAAGASPSQAAESGKRSVSSWVRSAQALLQTPQKPTRRPSKTPEDSGKKKRKFQRFDRLFFPPPQVRKYRGFFFPSDVKNNKSMHVALILPHQSVGGGGEQTLRFWTGCQVPQWKCFHTWFHTWALKGR